MAELAKLQQDLRMAADPVKAAFFPRFFKAGPGQYAEGDQFIGVTVPKQRAVAKAYAGTLTLPELQKLLDSPIHEERLTALLVLVLQYKNGSAPARRDIYTLFMRNTARVNNWDLVDSSAEFIVGPYLQDRDRTVLTKLAASELVWERRIAVLATFAYIKAADFEWPLRIITQLLGDKHDLIHKATGWMLREIGKRDRAVLVDFLAKHYRTMPRTMLRYAIEHFDVVERQRYLTGK